MKSTLKADKALSLLEARRFQPLDEYLAETDHYLVAAEFS